MFKHLMWVFGSAGQRSRHHPFLRVSAATCTPQACHPKAAHLDRVSEFSLRMPVLPAANNSEAQTMCDVLLTI